MDKKLDVISIIISFVVITTIPITHSSDPDPLQDYCIPLTTNTSNSFNPLFLPCKNPSLVTSDDFVFTGFNDRSPYRGAYSAAGSVDLSITATSFPCLNTLGMSFSRVDLVPGDSNPAHFHPRATEVAYVVMGQVLSGFVNSDNRVISRVLEDGDVMVFPRGIVHFQTNVGNSDAIVLGHFNSQNPGIQVIANIMQRSGMSDEVLRKAFGLTRRQVVDVRRKFLTRKV